MTGDGTVGRQGGGGVASLWSRGLRSPRRATSLLRICQYICIDTHDLVSNVPRMSAKSTQLQIRLTRAQKATLKRLARAARQDVSAYVLARALPEARVRFGEIVRVVRDDEQYRFGLAELNDLLAGLTPAQLRDAVAVAPPDLWGLSPTRQNYVAAMIEQACNRRSVPAPSWVQLVAPLDTPWFATSLRGLRLHLLRSAPVPFRRRNLFVDAGVGDRV